MNAYIQKNKSWTNKQTNKIEQMQKKTVMTSIYKLIDIYVFERYNICVWCEFSRAQAKSIVSNDNNEERIITIFNLNSIDWIFFSSMAYKYITRLFEFFLFVVCFHATNYAIKKHPRPRPTSNLINSNLYTKQHMRFFLNQYCTLQIIGTPIMFNSIVFMAVKIKAWRGR